MKQVLSQSIVSGGNRSVFADYALEFNGTDEYLQIALPNNELLASAGVTDFYSSGSAIAGWTETGTVAWDDISTDKTYGYCIALDVESGIKKTLSNLIIGQKYKLKLRYYGDGLNIGSEVGLSDYFRLLTTDGGWNTVSKIFTAVSSIIYFGTNDGESSVLDYASIKRDQGFDLNKDEEMVLHSRNTNFNNAGTDWVPKDGSSNQTCALSTVDKSEGTDSLLITATGVGDATDHHILLPSANLESCVATKKYTLEGFARLDPASLTYGSEKLGAINFAGDAGWTGDATKTDADTITFTAATQFVRKTYAGLISSTKTYKIRIAGTKTCGDIRVANYNVNVAYQTISSNTFDTTFYLNPTANSEGISITLVSGAGVGDANITAFELYEATPITLTGQLGTKSVTSSALSIVAGTFTKFVLNFEATASEVNQDLKLWLSGAGSVYVDKLSLTQAYDVAMVIKKKHSETQTDIDYILSLGGGGAVGYNITSTTANQCRTIAEDANSNAKESGTQINTPFTFVNILALINRTDTISILRDGGNAGFSNSTSTIGKIILLRLLIIGTYLTNGTSNFKGLLSHIQIIRFENISLSTFNSAITGLQYPTGGGAEEVLRVTFQSGVNITECLKDYSPKGHTVSGVNVDITNRKRVTI